MNRAPLLKGSQGSPLSAVAIIPARLGSTRLPRKMLLRETGQYLFEHTVKNVARGTALARVVLATDSDEIVAAAREVGIEALLTDVAHRSGTDRVQEAYEQLVQQDGASFDVILNVQGDEPEVAGEDLANLVNAFHDPQVEFATLWTPFGAGDDPASPAAVKVVLDERGDALYFSRSAIPSEAHRRADSPAEPLKRHLGVYAFRPAALARFCSLGEGALERLENLEQLRWLEAGCRLRVLRSTRAPRGIDTALDYQAFVERQSATGSPNTLLSKPPTS